MSAPKTNVDRQVARHRGPLFGMMAVGGFVAVLLLGWVLYESRGRDATEVPPEGAPVTEAPATEAPAATEPAPGATPPATTAPSEPPPSTP
jgi:hypothetical protein